jgi:hypothetical protein
MQIVDALSAGDILLLSGRSKTRLPNCLYQSALRRRVALFSHVAVAYSAFSIADSNPKVGVKVRNWSSALKSYDLSRSIILRSTKSIDAEKILSSIHYFLTQPYSLKTFTRGRKDFRDQEGLACSQFVAAVFQRAGVVVSVKHPRKTFPEDIASRLLDETNNWNQFEFSKDGSVALDPSRTLELLDLLSTSTIERRISLTRSTRYLTSLVEKVCESSSPDAESIKTLQRLIAAFGADSAVSHLDLWKQTFLLQGPVIEQFTSLANENYSIKDAKQVLAEYTKVVEEVIGTTFPRLQDEIKQIAARHVQALKLCAHSNDDTVSKLLNQTSAALIQALRQAIEMADSIFPPELAPAAKERFDAYPELITHIVSGETNDPETALASLQSLSNWDLEHASWPTLRSNYCKMTEMTQKILEELDVSNRVAT